MGRHLPTQFPFPLCCFFPVFVQCTLEQISPASQGCSSSTDSIKNSAGALSPSFEPEKAFSPRRTEVTGGKIPLEQKHQANMTSPWFCLLQDFQNLFGTHWPNFATAEVGFVFSPLGQIGQWQIGTKFIEVLSRLEVHGNFSDSHWIFFKILFFLMRNSGFSKKALQGQFTNYC